MVRSGRTLAAALLAVCLASARADDFIGGEGGSEFGAINCPRGLAVVGLFGRSGHVIDTFQLVCGNGNGAESRTIIMPTRIGPSNGGSPVSAACGDLEVAVSLGANVREFNGNIVVSQIILRCELVGTSIRGRTVVLGQGGGTDAGSSDCPEHTFMAGIAGRLGSFVDAVGISTCRRMSSLARP